MIPYSIRVKVCLALLMLLPLLHPPGAEASQARDMTSRIDSAVSRAIEEQRIIGGVILVSRHGRIVYQKAFGMADREKGVPAQEDTLFRLASMTKPLVTAAALALADQGRLSLNDPVSKWLPWFEPRLKDGSQAVITVRNLLNHTSGLSYGFLQPPGGSLSAAGVSDGLDLPGITLEENLKRLSTAPLDFPPGSGWQYSLSTDVLGAVVAAAAGEPLPQAVARLVTGPLGMLDTTFLVGQPGRLATPYVLDKAGPHRMGDPETMPFGLSGIRYQPSRATSPQAYPSGGAGMSGTARDYVLFLEAIRRDGRGILKRSTARSMTENQIGGLRPGMLGDGWAFGYGAAVVLDPVAGAFPGNKGAWRWGGVYGSCFFVDKTAGLSVVVLTNTTPEGMSGTFAEDVIKAVYGR